MEPLCGGCAGAAARLPRGSGGSHLRGCVTARGFRGASKLLGGGGGAAVEKRPPPQPPTTATARLLASVRWPPGSGSSSSSADGSPSGSSSSMQEQDLQQQEAGAPAGSSSNTSSYLALLAVSLLWGSYAPSLRYLYSMDPLLTPQVLTAHRAVISAATLVAASAATWAYDRHRQRQQQLRELQLLQQEREREEAARRRWLGLLPSLVLNMLSPFGSSSSTTSGRVGGSSSSSREQQQRWSLPFGGLFPDDNSTRTVLDFFSRFRTPLGTGGAQSDAAAAAAAGGATDAAATSGRSAAAAVLLAGLELGTWNFLATAAQACGLELSTATKAAFLTQTTAVFTPCVAVLFGQAVLPAHWVACLAALVGSCCITMDSVVLAAGDESGSSSASLAAVAEVRMQAPGADTAATAEVLVAPPLLAASDAAADTQDSLEQQEQQQRQEQQLKMLLPSVQLQQQQGEAWMPDQGAPAALAAGAGPGQLLPAGSAASGDAACLDAEGWRNAQLAGGAAASAGALPELGASGPAAAALAAGAAVQQLAPAAAGAPGGGAYAAAAAVDAWQQGGAASAGSVAFSDGAAAGDAAAASTSGPADLQLPPAAKDASPDAAAVAAAAAAVSSSSFVLSGEVYILAACCCYAMATVRLSMLAPGLDPVQLATSKTLTLAAASLLWLVALGPGDAPTAAAAAADGTAQPAAGEGVVAAVQAAAASWQLPPAFDYGPGLALLCYSAIGPGALATVLQTKGQSTASAAQAQVYYSLTPVWAALLANSWLEGEAMGTMAWVGGGIILAASIAAAVSDAGPDGQAQADGGGGGAAGQ